MRLSYQNDYLGGIFSIRTEQDVLEKVYTEKDNLIHIIWNNCEEAASFTIDGIATTLHPAELTTVTFFHKVEFNEQAKKLTVFSFNREYYCIRDHDSEVSCNGIIFFGAQERSRLKLSHDQQRKFRLLLEVFKDEFENQDNIQGEMLLMLLKRLIILCTRLAREQIHQFKVPSGQIDIIREFNVLVDYHFRKAKTVKEYADMLHRSPKTLANHFARLGQKSPLQLIHDRITLEARRLLIYTDKTANEIAYDLGFTEPATFFKLFKKQLLISPQKFREQQQQVKSGNLAIQSGRTTSS